MSGTLSGGLPPAKGPENEAAFPTEQRLRQKARAKAGHVAKKRPQVVEDHHDDCGEDFGPLGDDPYFQDEPEFQTHLDDEVCMPPCDVGMNSSDWAPDAARPVAKFSPPRRVPHGVTLIGRLFDEGLLAQVGLAMEKAAGVSAERPPGFF